MLIDSREAFVREFGEGAEIFVDGVRIRTLKSFNTDTLECTDFIVGYASEENLPDGAYMLGVFAVMDFTARELVVKNYSGDVIFSSAGC